MAMGIMYLLIHSAVQACLVNYNLLISSIVSPSGRKSVLAFTILNFLLLPLTMFLFTAILFSIGAFIMVHEGCCRRMPQKFRSGGIITKLLIIILYLVLFCILEPLAIAASAALTALVIIPAYIFQFYKIVKIIIFWGCKNSDKR